MVTIALALVFLTLEIDKQLANHGTYEAPIIYRVIIASYLILMPNFFLTIWATSKDQSKPPNAFVHAINNLKRKCNKVDNTNERKMFDESQQNEQDWLDFELLLQNLIFAIQVLFISLTHGKPPNSTYLLSEIQTLNREWLGHEFHLSELSCANIYEAR